MEILIKKILVSCLICFSIQLKAQTSEMKNVEDAFSSSYTLELKAEYNATMAILKTVYDEKSYEINLRLGWLNYLAGLFTESSAYYQKAISLKPYSIEAKLGFAYPAAALGNLDQVIKQYQEILKIDPQNTIANYRMGSILYGKKEYADADKYLELDCFGHFV